MENQLRLQINSQRAAMLIAALEKISFIDETKKLDLENVLYGIMMEDYLPSAPKNTIRTMNTPFTEVQTETPTTDDRI